MAPLQLSHRRRRPSSSLSRGDEEDADIVKRPRYSSQSPDLGEDGFMPGAIVAMKLTNFVTYSSAEFKLGPNLNMIIGPNGTGKSSFVCGIAIGLGWGVSHLGRAGKVGEFVKHGSNSATIEIELQRRKNESRNHIIKVRIVRDGNQKEWWLNGRKVSLNEIQELTRSLSIQIDNLCQFLPQDKVSEFAALTPIELLHETQRAAAPEEMLEWHKQLKAIRKDQKSLEVQHEGDRAHFQNLENRQQNLRAEVERLEERNKIEKQIDILEKTVPFVEYTIAHQRHTEFKQKKIDAQKRFKDLRAQVQPTLQLIDQKKIYQGQVRTVVAERKEAVKLAEKTADSILEKIEKLVENIGDFEQKQQAERDLERLRRTDVRKLERVITDLKARQNQTPIEFDSVAWNERIRIKERELKDIVNESDDLTKQYSELMGSGKECRARLQKANDDLAAFDTQEGQLMSKLDRTSRDTAKAWKWVQENQDQFEKEVYGPPMITCSIKDPRYIDVIESLFQTNNFLTITAQTKADFNKLNHQLLEVMRLSHVTLRSTPDLLSDLESSGISSQDFQRYGFDAWALDLIDGPETVLAMLCDNAHINKTPVSIREMSEAQYNMAVQNDALSKWACGKTSYSVSRRREYGPSAMSTMTRSIRPAQAWTDQPVDNTEKRRLEERLKSLTEEFESLKEQSKPIKDKMESLKEQAVQKQEVIVALRKEKAEVQKAYGQQMTLPDKIRREEEALEAKQQEGSRFREKMRNFQNQHDYAVIRKMTTSLDHKNQVAEIRVLHEELLDAEIRLLEAASDVEALEQRNAGITQYLDEEERIMKDAEREAKIVKDKASTALRIVKGILAEAEVNGTREHFLNIPVDKTVEGLQMEIEAEKSKLEYIHAGNPNAIRDFEKRRADIDKLGAKMTETQNKLEQLSKEITELRAKWEPRLDQLIGEINEAFAYNFEKIGCAGEVGVHKDEDFDQWAIQIKVKFRENETLQQLDQHRQSGGERSVSTIFFLMSLQSLARAPFRVVDEINQGMDPRNERMVHERMVEIACKEHTSQYFLITPKLLTGLRYDRRMKLLCIASGEHMPQDYRRLDVKRIIGIKRAMIAAG
ncbi:hypothetical protein B7494_g3479 [Chlorociboria aeruginascens]|nr:hypothetical protein B7494_g3479 [Chlorociboria aeruginascens]